jgi:hypothetical protein
MKLARGFWFAWLIALLSLFAAGCRSEEASTLGPSGPEISPSEPVDISGNWVGFASWDYTFGEIQAIIADRSGSFTGSWVWDDGFQQKMTESFTGTIAGSGQIEIHVISGGVTAGTYSAKLSPSLSSSHDTISGYWTMDSYHSRGFTLIKQ